MSTSNAGVIVNFLKPGFSPGPATSWSGTIIGNSASLLDCMSMALAQLTDKMDPMYIIPK